MGDSYFNQIRDIYIWIIQKILKIPHQFTDKLMMRGYETGVSNGIAANPVLACPVFTRHYMLSANAIQQYLMCRTNKP